MVGGFPQQRCAYTEIIASFEHLISGTRSNKKHPETGGGILADDMGLGKTLTILATVVATISAAANFQSEMTTSNTADFSINIFQYRSRATLVVVPSHST
jgi:hypothetical protein